MKDRFDAIVVGAGPAGCACGYKLGKAGLNTLVVERGKFAGAKNMWGGVFYGPALGELFPDFSQQAPFERYVTRRRLSLVTDEDCLTIEFTTPTFQKAPFNGIIALRSKFDRWFATKVQEAGVAVVSGVQADDLLWDGKRVVGIKAGNDEIPANMVIACDGVNSILAQKAHLRGELASRDVKQGVKEVIQLTRQVIEQRFNLKGDEGIAWEFLGSFSKGLPGGGFIYTNKDSLSVGVVAQLSALAKRKLKADDLLESFKQHPVVASLIEGGKLVEYSAHLIPVLGIEMMPKLYTNGMLVAGDAAAFVLSTGLILEGANFAIASGIAAAKAVVRAKEKGDFSVSSLSYYQELLKQSFVLKDLETFKKAPQFLEKSAIYESYPALVCDFARKIFINDGQAREITWDVLRQTMKGRVSLLRLARDLLMAKGAV